MMTSIVGVARRLRMTAQNRLSCEGDQQFGGLGYPAKEDLEEEH
jgi:hypothetical protein